MVIKIREIEECNISWVSIGVLLSLTARYLEAQCVELSSLDNVNKGI